MMGEIIIRPEAENEIEDAYDWYENRVPGLGADLLLAIDAILHGISRNPNQYPIIYRNIHRALTRRFPYEILYIVEKTQIVVLAVFHARRNPKSWKTRT